MEIANTLLICLFGLLNLALGSRITKRSAREAQDREHEIQRERDRDQRAHRDRLERAKAYKEWFEILEVYRAGVGAAAIAIPLLGDADPESRRQVTLAIDQFVAAAQRFSASSNYLLMVECDPNAKRKIQNVRQMLALPQVQSPPSTKDKQREMRLKNVLDFQAKVAQANDEIESLIDTVRIPDADGNEEQ